MAPCSILLALCCSVAATLSAFHSQDNALTPPLLDRALPNAPDGYTPLPESCPAQRPTIRSATALSPNETDWLSVRRPQTFQAMKTLFAGMNITGIDTDAYIDDNSHNASLLPNIAIAVSGGGYRAMMNGAGALAAFDSRTRHNSTTGSLGGLLQSTTYLAGLSGGSWLVGSLYVNNFTSVQKIIDENTADPDSGDLWQFGNSIFEGPADGAIQLIDTIDYYTTIADQVKGKENAGFNTTITDYWGRALSFQLISAPAGGPDYTFSSIADQNFFTNGSAPAPLIVADARSPGQYIVSTNSTIYEFSPWELGSYDPTTFGFAPLEYLGSNFTDGSIAADQECVRGFDNAGYIMGTSSSIWNQVLTTLNETGDTNLLYLALEDIFRALSADDLDIADYVNPFIGYNNATNDIYNNPQLTLVDGATDGQNIPFHPLIQPLRQVDVIFAVDSSADTNSSSIAANWPNGTSMILTYERQFLPIGNGTVFPSVPDPATFVNLGLNNRPTFFGCNASNLTGPAPLIVYLPNAPYIYDSNISTLDPSFSDSVRNALIENGYDIATMGNGTLDPQWPTCVGCAILNRSLNRTSTSTPAVCTECFERYCWNGTLNTIYKDYDPTYKLDRIKTSGASSWPAKTIAAIVAALTVALLVAF